MEMQSTTEIIWDERMDYVYCLSKQFRADAAILVKRHAIESFHAIFSQPLQRKKTPVTHVFFSIGT